MNVLFVLKKHIIILTMRAGMNMNTNMNMIITTIVIQMKI